MGRVAEPVGTKPSTPDLFNAAFKSSRPQSNGSSGSNSTTTIFVSRKMGDAQEDDEMDFLKNLGEDTGNAIGGAAQSVVNAGGSILDAAATAVEGTASAVTSGIENITGAAGELVTDAGEVVDDTYDELTSRSGAEFSTPTISTPTPASLPSASHSNRNKKKITYASKPCFSVVGVQHSVIDDSERSIEPEITFTVPARRFSAARDRYYDQHRGGRPEAGYASKSIPISLQCESKALVHTPSGEVVPFMGALHMSVREGHGVTEPSSFSSFTNKIASSSGSHCHTVCGGSGKDNIDLRAMLHNKMSFKKPRDDMDIQKNDGEYSNGKAMVLCGSTLHTCSSGTKLGRALSSAGKVTHGGRTYFKGVDQSLVKDSMEKIAHAHLEQHPVNDLGANGVSFSIRPSQASYHSQRASSTQDSIRTLPINDILKHFPSGSKIHVHTQYAFGMSEPDFHPAPNVSME